MNILIYGDTLTSPAMRHEVPIAIGDPFLYLETDGRKAVLTNSLEDARIARDAPELERMLEEQLGRDELIGSGLSRSQIDREMCVRAADRLGITEAIVPRSSLSAWPTACAKPALRCRPTTTCSSNGADTSQRPR